jgi:predicted NUDIX family phosphoesterase
VNSLGLDISSEKDISDAYNHVTTTKMRKIAMIREIYEEIRIKEHNIKDLVCIGLIDNKK